MEFNLLTREEALKITEQSEVFYVTKSKVEEFNVEMYDYRLASYNDFVNNKAFEMRGLTFVYNDESKEWERNLALTKFFNINQTEDWMYDDVKHKKIVSLANKLDGSMITFVKFPNNKILAKSKMSFISPQAEFAQEIYNKNQNYKDFLNFTFDNKLTAIFELVSPHNQVVLSYDETELNLLQVRKENGSYYSMDELKKVGLLYSIKIALPFDLDNHSLDVLLLLKQTEKDIEGWVITFEDGQMAKVKTEWYLSLHGLISSDVMRENLVIKTILDENIDDVLAELKEGSEKRNYVENMVKCVTHYFSHNVKRILDLREKYFNEFNEDRKRFSLAHSKEDCFSVVMRSLNFEGDELEKFVEKQLKETILKKTNSLNDAKKFIKSIDVNNEIKTPEKKSKNKSEDISI